MKNIIIGALIVIVLVAVYLLFMRQDGPNESVPTTTTKVVDEKDTKTGSGDSTRSTQQPAIQVDGNEVKYGDAIKINENEVDVGGVKVQY